MFAGPKGEKGDKGEHGESNPWGDCPICPEIKNKIDKIYVALLGTDGLGLKDGLVHAVTSLQQTKRVQASWVGFAKPIIIGAVSALVGAAITYLLILH